jgi:S1-C subfamily serine protease
MHLCDRGGFAALRGDPGVEGVLIIVDEDSGPRNATTCVSSAREAESTRRSNSDRRHADAATTVSGCGLREESREQATSAERPSDPQPVVPVEAPDSQLADAPAVATAKASVVMIRGDSPGCVLEGSGFVVAPNRVMTPAQIVAGGETFTVEVGGQTLDAHVVSYDHRRDLAILDVPNLTALPLSFAVETAVGGSDAILLGYPEGSDDIAVILARIREVIQLNGPDIYRTATVSREVYTIRGGGVKGASGGPLIDRDGHVLGISFGVAVDDADTGFALTAKEIAPQLGDLTNTVPVATGRERC